MPIIALSSALSSTLWRVSCNTTARLPAPAGAAFDAAGHVIEPPLLGPPGRVVEEFTAHAARRSTP